MPLPVGARGEQHPEGSARVFAEEPELPARKPERFQRKRLEAGPEAALVEHPDHDVFTVHARHDRNPEVHGPGTAIASAGKRRPEPSILRYPALRDVEFRHHLEPGDDRLVVRPVHRLHRRIENAVHPILQNDFPGLGLDVDVGARRSMAFTSSESTSRTTGLPV